MKARTLTLAALCALAAACGDGGEQEPKAGDSLDPGPTGTIESTGPQTGTTAPADTATATDASTAGGATATPSTAPNAPPAMTPGATEGDTTKSP